MLFLFLLLQEPAQEQPKEKEPIVISASPLKGVDPFTAPYSADVVSSEDLTERRSSRTVPEALKELPTVSVQKTAHGHGSPFLRGFTGFRNLFLIDGIRLNNSIFREGPNQYWNTVDSYLIDRMEILRGPASVLYGSDSMGGTVSVFTKSRGSFEPGLHVGGVSILRAATAERSIAVRQEVEGNWDNVGWLFGGTFRNYEDIMGGPGVFTQDETGYSEYSGDGKISLLLAPSMRLHVAVQSGRQFDVPRTHQTRHRIAWHGIPDGSTGDSASVDAVEFDQERDLAYVLLEWEKIGEFIDALRFSVSLHRHHEEFNRVWTDGRREFRKFTVTSPGVVLHLSSESPVGYLTYGGEFYHEDVQTGGFNFRPSAPNPGTFHLDRGDVADDAVYQSGGLFLQDEIDIGDGFLLTLGARYAWASLDADQVALAPGVVNASNGSAVDPDLSTFPSLSETYQAIVGNARVTWQADEHWVFFAGASQAFRAPNLDDTTSFRLRTEGQTMDLPSADLDPERALQVEGGLRVRYDRWSFGISAFHTFLEDHIRRVPFADVDGDGDIDSRKENFANGKTYGVEAQASIPLGAWLTFTAGFSWVEGYADDVDGSGNSWLSKLNPMTAIGTLRLQPPESAWWAEVVALAVAKQDKLSPDDETDNRIPPGGTPGFVLGTVRGGYAFNENVSLNVSVENVANVNYRFHGSGQNEPGTNVLIGMRIGY